VRAIAGCGHGLGCTPERPFVGERAQQLILAGRRIVHSRDNRIDQMQLRIRGDALGCDAGTGTNPSECGRGVLQRANYCRPDRHDPVALGDGAIDR